MVLVMGMPHCRDFIARERDDAAWQPPDGLPRESEGAVASLIVWRVVSSHVPPHR